MIPITIAKIAILNLSLKAIKTRKKLPYLADHIKCGNSLISDENVALEKAFNWSKEFKEVMELGGFNVIIGNPPYVRVQNLNYADIDLSLIHI